MGKDEGGAGYEAVTCFMARDVGEKYQPHKHLLLGHLDISVVCKLSEMFVDRVAAKLHSPTKRMPTPSCPHSRNTFQFSIYPN